MLLFFKNRLISYGLLLGLTAIIGIPSVSMGHYSVAINCVEDFEELQSTKIFYAKIIHDRTKKVIFDEGLTTGTKCNSSIGLDFQVNRQGELEIESAKDNLRIEDLTINTENADVLLKGGLISKYTSANVNTLSFARGNTAGRTKFDFGKFIAEGIQLKFMSGGIDVSATTLRLKGSKVYSESAKLIYRDNTPGSTKDLPDLYLPMGGDIKIPNKNRSSIREYMVRLKRTNQVYRSQISINGRRIRHLPQPLMSETNTTPQPSNRQNYHLDPATPYLGRGFLDDPYDGANDIQRTIEESRRTYAEEEARRAVQEAAYQEAAYQESADQEDIEFQIALLESREMQEENDEIQLAIALSKQTEQSRRDAELKRQQERSYQESRAADKAKKDAEKQLEQRAEKIKRLRQQKAKDQAEIARIVDEEITSELYEKIKQSRNTVASFETNLARFGTKPSEIKNPRYLKAKDLIENLDPKIKVALKRIAKLEERIEKIDFE
ncbi:MAG: hypothetical protein ABFQ95_03890 [Pseudomonadota bacterium]